MTITSPSTETPAELAARYGLSPSSARPPLPVYLRQLWERRHFITAFATSRLATQYSGARLGQLWQVLTPLFNAGVYFLLFGLLLGARGKIDNYTAYLVTGVFVFTSMQRSVTSASRSIGGNLALIRALHFPRASLPLSSTLVELQQLLISMVVLCLIVVVTGEPLSWTWLLVIPALSLMTLFNIGIGMAIARVGAFVQDINQLLPFITRTWLYTSGVFFSIPEKTANAPEWVGQIMMANPAAVYIELVRDALMASHPTDLHTLWPVGVTWALAVGWAAVALTAGLWFFWSAEEKYGRG
ncbi:MAG TPA: ABC transporter permease [Actinopolymorphaceae bacterium]